MLANIVAYTNKNPMQRKSLQNGFRDIATHANGDIGHVTFYNSHSHTLILRTDS